MPNSDDPQQNLYGQSLNPETVIRINKHEPGFLVVANATVQDERLSWEARGLLVYLLSLPADWDIRVSHLQNQGGAGRDALRRMLHELQRYGYASGVGRENQERTARGRFSRQVEIRVYETPALNPNYSEENSPSPENPSTVKPSTAEPSPEKASPYKEHNPQSTQETKTHTQRHLRAAGAPEDRVCVNRFPLKTFERYALNHPTDIRSPVGWASTARRTGEWDERVERWCAEHDIDPLTGENLTTASDEFKRPLTSERKCPPTCPLCFGGGMQVVEGKGARRCPNLTAPRHEQEPERMEATSYAKKSRESEPQRVATA